MKHAKSDLVHHLQYLRTSLLLIDELLAAARAAQQEGEPLVFRAVECRGADDVVGVLNKLDFDDPTENSAVYATRDAFIEWASKSGAWATREGEKPGAHLVEALNGDYGDSQRLEMFVSAIVRGLCDDDVDDFCDALLAESAPASPISGGD